MATMMIDYCDLTVPGIRELQPYQPGKPIDELQRELGLKEIIKLASNENPFGPSPKAIQALQTELTDLARYPDGNGFVLKQRLSEHLGVEQNQITLGNGSNDILELVARVFINQGDEAIYSEHSFAVYPLACQAVGANHFAVPAKDWGYDIDAIVQRVSDKTKVIFIANPNNPTGTWVNKASLEPLLNSVPKTTIVVIDEAYFEYATDPAMQAIGYPNSLEFVTAYPNVIVTRTFSKAYGLAGLRVGYSVSSAQIADLLNRVRQPFNVNSLALAGAVAALDDSAHLTMSVEKNAQGMQQLMDAFEQMGLGYIPSIANFISFDLGKPAQTIYQALLERGVIVRPVANYGMPHHLRVTVGTEQENAFFLAALKDILSL